MTLRKSRIASLPEACYNAFTKSVNGAGKRFPMEEKNRIRELREQTGMNRKEFCAHFQIPYRTVTDWERNERHAPDYVVRLLDHYIQTEQLRKAGGGE